MYVSPSLLDVLDGGGGGGGVLEAAGAETGSDVSGLATLDSG